MTIKHEIEIEGLPEGWHAVAYRCPKKFEHYFDAEEKRLLMAPLDHGSARLIVEKIKPRRIVLEETEDETNASGSATVYFGTDVTLDIYSEKIWRLVEGE